MKRLVAVNLVIFAFAFSIYCASIMHGTTQEVGFGSSPTAAKVSVNGKELGNTPIIEDLKRKNQYLVKIELEGYLPYETTITKKVSGWVWGNVLFGGLLGLAVDAITGGLYNLHPEQIQAELRRGTAFKIKDNTLYIFTVLHPKPDWEKVGTLNKVY